MRGRHHTGKRILDDKSKGSGKNLFFANITNKAKEKPYDFGGIIHKIA